MSANPDDGKPRPLTVDLTQVLADVPSRLARVEAHVETIRGDIGELKTGQEKLRDELRADFKFLLRLMVAGFGALATLILASFGALWGIMAHGFRWIG